MSPIILPLFIRERIAKALGRPARELPTDSEGTLDLISPMLADYTRTKATLITDCEAFGIPTTDDDGPRSLYQMTGDVVKRWRSAADDSSDLAEVRSRLTAAGYVPAPGEAVGDLVARALRDTREADDKREAAERETEILRDQLRNTREHARDHVRAAQEHAQNLAAQLNHAANLIGSLAATISRLTH